MTAIQICTIDGRIHLACPYDKELVAGAKEIGGRWSGAKRVWTFDPRDEDRVRELARSVFGTDGSAADQADLITIRWDISNYCQRRGDDELRIAGRVVARRPGRDSDVRLGEGVILISGGFPGSAGSMRYPSLEPLDNTVIEIRDLPRQAVDLDNSHITLVDSTIDVDALRAERDKLIARISELDAAIAAASPAIEEDATEAAVTKAVPAEHHTPGMVTIRIPVADSGITGLSTTAYAEHAGCSPRTARRWAASGRIAATRTTSGWIITA